jgi:hypothetical protein
MAKSRAKLAELEPLEGGGAGGSGGGSGVGGTKWSNLPSMKGSSNMMSDLKRMSTDTSHLKGGAKEAVEEAKRRAANRTGVRAVGIAGLGAVGKAAMDDDEPDVKPKKDTDEDNFQETKRIMREVDSDIKGSKYGKGDGMKSGGKVTASRKMKKFDMGGGVGAAEALTPAGRREAFNEAMDDLYSPIIKGRTDFAIGSPERQNYQTYMRSLPDRAPLNDAARASNDYSLSNLPTLAAYDPTKTYTRPEKIDEDKIAKPPKVETVGRGQTLPMQRSAMQRSGMVKKMASGGMTSSASKRGDGIATKGKTRGKMC